jgi:hypothetical protein
MVRELAKNILKDEKQMLLLTDELNQKLKALEGSFLDDGINEVKTYVTDLSKRLVGAQLAFETLASELKAYSDLLKAGKGGSQS